MNYRCSVCGKELGLLREKFLLRNEKGEELVFCLKCYEAIPKEDKLKLTPVKPKKGSGFNVGYLIGGIAGGIGFSSAQNEIIMNPIRRYNLTLDEINRFFIMKINKHFLLCDHNTKAAFMAAFEKELKKKKLDEISQNKYGMNFDVLDRRSKRDVKKEFKKYIKDNMKRNKHLKNLKVFLNQEGVL